MKNKGKERIKETKKREELECVGGVKGSKLTRNWSVRTGCGCVGVWRRVDRYRYRSNSEACCVFVCMFSTAHTVQRCCAALQTNCQRTINTLLLEIH